MDLPTPQSSRWLIDPDSPYYTEATVSAESRYLLDPPPGWTPTLYPVNHPVRRNGGKARIRRAVWNKSGGLCWYCGGGLIWHQDFEVDHFIPLAQQGSDDLNNLVPACCSCNSAKGARDVAWLRTYLQARLPNGLFHFETIGGMSS